MSIPVSIQLFSVREFMEKDSRGTLRALSEMGYDGIEPANGSYDMKAEEFRSLCDELNLKIPSAHVSYEQMCEKLDEVVELYKILGTKYIIIPYMLEDNRPGSKNFDEVAENIRRISRTLSENGMQLLYHNHAFEFEKIGDKYQLDYQFELFTAEELGFELDCCWVKASGEDPSEYIKKFSSRCPLVHIKDYARYERKSEDGKSVDYEMEFRPVGCGVQDVASLINAARSSGAEWLVVEQDGPTKCKELLNCMQESINYLKKLQEII